MPRRLSHFLFRSVRGRLVLLVIALVVPAAVLASAMVIKAYDNERKSVATTQLSTARAISGLIDAKIDETVLLLKSFCSSNALLRDDLHTFETVVRQALRDDSRWFVLLTPDGKQVLNTRASGKTLPTAEFKPALREAMLRGETYVSDLERSRSTNEPVIHISRPFFRGDRLTYIVSLTLPAHAIAEQLNLSHYAPGKVVTIVDRTRTIVARTRNPELFVGASASREMTARLNASSEGILDSVTLDKIPSITAFSRARCGWTTVIAAPKSELFASAGQLLRWGATGAFFLLIVALVMAAWIGRALVHSADVLCADADTLARGETPGSASTGLDESDFIAGAMRRTAITLLRRTRMLEVVNRISAGLVVEKDLGKILQSVTDAGRELSGAQFGAFFYHTHEPHDKTCHLFTVSPLATFGELTRNTRLQFADAGLDGTSMRRVADVTAEPDYKSIASLFNFTPVPLTVRSCLIAPVKSRTGEMIGWLLYSHEQPGMFNHETEDVLAGLTGEASIAIDNAKLYHALARELDAKSATEAELRIAQDRLREHARELEQKVAERTASLREAVTQMEEFSYTVSHDLRAPLRSMHAFADALMEDYGAQLDDTARDYLQRIQRASRRMDQLTTNLLRYSRVARSEVRLEPTDTETVVRSTIEHYGELQSPSADVRIASPLAPVLAHEPSLSQCVANLLTNSAKFVRAGEKPRITVRTERIGGRVRVWIEDQGIGIPPEYQRALFKIFERVPNHARYEGTGVGLAIVRKAAEKMGGSCGVESDGKNGSRFWIDLAAA